MSHNFRNVPINCLRKWKWGLSTRKWIWKIFQVKWIFFIFSFSNFVM